MKRVVSAAAGAPPKVAPKVGRVSRELISVKQMKRAVEKAQGMADSDSEPDSDSSQVSKKARTLSPCKVNEPELVKVPIGERIKTVHKHLPNQAMRGENGMFRPESVFPQWPWIRDVLGEECARGISTYLNGVNDTIVMKFCEYIVQTMYDTETRIRRILGDEKALIAVRMNNEVSRLSKALAYARLKASQDSEKDRRMIEFLKRKFSQAFHLDREDWDGRSCTVFTDDNLEAMCDFIEARGRVIIPELEMAAAKEAFFAEGKKAAEDLLESEYALKVERMREDHAGEMVRLRKQLKDEARAKLAAAIDVQDTLKRKVTELTAANIAQKVQIGAYD